MTKYAVPSLKLKLFATAVVIAVNFKFLSMIFLIAAFVLSLIYLFVCYRLNYWNRKNVPSVPTNVFSSIISMFYLPTPLFNYYANIYNQMKGHKYGGCFSLLQPEFVVRDPEIIKHILVKDFEYFRDRGNVVFDEYDPITNHLFSSPAVLWKGKLEINVLQINLHSAYTNFSYKS